MLSCYRLSLLIFFQRYNRSTLTLRFTWVVEYRDRQTDGLTDQWPSSFNHSSCVFVSTNWIARKTNLCRFHNPHLKSFMLVNKTYNCGVNFLFSSTNIFWASPNVLFQNGFVTFIFTPKVFVRVVVSRCGIGGLDKYMLRKDTQIHKIHTIHTHT